MTTPRGLRNRNPGNIRYVEGITSKYEGCTGSDGAFCIFDTDRHGIRALCRLLLVYQTKHGLNTVRGCIDRWAPPSENDTAAYIDAVSRALNVAPDDEIDLHLDFVLAGFASAIIRHENGQQPYAPGEILAAAHEALGYAYAKPASPAPVDEADMVPVPPVETPMPEESTTSWGWGDLVKIAGPIAAAFNPIAGLVVSAFTPLLQEKIGKELGRHTDPVTAKTVASNLTDVISKVAIRETGKSDPVEALLAVRADPALIAKAEAAVTSRLAELAPFIDKMEELESKERADIRAAQDAAGVRARSEVWDMTPWLVGWSLGMVTLVLAFFGVVAIIDMAKSDSVSTEVWAALTGISGTLLGIVGTIIAYRFASTQQSAAKNALIGEMARRA